MSKISIGKLKPNKSIIAVYSKKIPDIKGLNLAVFCQHRQLRRTKGFILKRF